MSDARLECASKRTSLSTQIGASSTSPMRVFAIRIACPLDVTIERLHHADARTSFVDIAILRFLLFAFMKAFQDRRAPWYQRGLIRKPLRKIGVILLHDVEHHFLGEPALVLGK
jgi:hypothetical protein